MALLLLLRPVQSTTRTRILLPATNLPWQPVCSRSNSEWPPCQALGPPRRLLHSSRIRWGPHKDGQRGPSSSSEAPRFDFRHKPPPHANARLRTSGERNRTTLYYVLALAVVTAGGSYAAVPLYRMFCQSTGYGGTTQDGSAGHGSTERVSADARVCQSIAQILFLNSR